LNKEEKQLNSKTFNKYKKSRSKLNTRKGFITWQMLSVLLLHLKQVMMLKESKVYFKEIKKINLILLPNISL